MARLSRVSLPGYAHGVRQATVHGQALTLVPEDQQVLLSAMRDLSSQYRVAIWAYGLQAQAFEAVLCPETPEGVGRFMQALGRRYVQAFNRRHDRRGALWAGRYRATVVETGDWLLDCIQHVEQQAWRARLPSSAPHHLGQTRDAVVTDAPAFWALGNTPFERELAWRQRLEQGLAPETERTLARAVQGGWVVGSPTFVADMESITGRPAQPRRPGRPRRIPES